MSRYKGQQKATRTQLEFPHYVDILVPPDGLGTRLDAMYAFYTQHGIKPRSAGAGKASTTRMAQSFGAVLPMRV